MNVLWKYAMDLWARFQPPSMGAVTKPDFRASAGPASDAFRNVPPRGKLLDGLPGGYARLVPIWADASRNSFKKESRWSKVEVRLAQNVSGDQFQDVPALHLFDFMADIRDRVETLAGRHKVAVLDLGSGLGLFTDGLRAEFGDAVKVYGTALASGSTRSKRRILVEQARAGLVTEFPPLANPLRIKKVAGMPARLNHDDVKWRSILEMRNEPEFDLIIDTYGELHYAVVHDVEAGNDKELPFFNALLQAACRKLRPSGALHVARIDIAELVTDARDFMWRHCEEIEKREGVTIYFGRLTKRQILASLGRRRPDAFSDVVRDFREGKYLPIGERAEWQLAMETACQGGLVIQKNRVSGMNPEV